MIIQILKDFEKSFNKEARILLRDIPRSQDDINAKTYENKDFTNHNNHLSV